MHILWVVALVVVVDQASKMLVRTTMYMYQSIPVLGDWFRLTYTENPGMAFGITIGPPPFTTIFALLATVLLVVALWRVRTGHVGYRMSLALILGGAIGNIIDRAFYGVIFGYGGLFQGRVVDFIHFDVWRGTLSFPLLGDFYMALFPIWNVADMAIVSGAVAIMIFHNRFLDHESFATDGTRQSSTTAPVPSVNGKDASIEALPADDPARENRS